MTEKEWERRARHAEERVRRLAALFNIPDGARYLVDCREVAELHERRAQQLEQAEQKIKELEQELSDAYKYGPPDD